MSSLRYAQLTDKGKVRPSNQDAVASLQFAINRDGQDLDCGLFVVIDGMGASPEGEKAARAAIEMICQQASEFVLKSLLETGDYHLIPKALSVAFREANRFILKNIPEGGTAATAAFVFGHTLYLAHVGDTRIYLITQEEIKQLTHDHSLVQRLIELNQITEDEAADHPHKNVLYRAIGQFDLLDIDTLTQPLPPNSHLLLCSDGLWNHVKAEAMMDIVKNNYSPQEACDKLIALAKTCGAEDNISIIVVKIGEDDIDPMIVNVS